LAIVTMLTGVFLLYNTEARKEVQVHYRAR